MANNGKTSSEISQNILDAFEIMATAQVNAAQFDKTVIGIVVSCEDEAIGKYKVQYQDSIFYAYSSSLDMSYTKGTSVQIRIPNNDFSNRKVIVGVAEDNGTNYNNIIIDPLLRYENIGTDCIIQNTQIELSTYWTENKNTQIVYDITNPIAENKLNIDIDSINENIAKGDSILLGATIQTNIESKQKFSGNYGIIYTLTFKKATDASETINRDYYIDINQMNGQPYNYIAPSDQIFAFNIDSANFLYIKQIKVFAKNFPNIDNNKPADIFINNIRFQIAKRLSDAEYAGTALIVLTPDGNFFQGDQYVSKQAIAELRIQGKIIDSSFNRTQYYWFIEDLLINDTQEIGYSKYGGLGWRCLNDYNVVEWEDEEHLIPRLVEYTGRQTNVFDIKKSNSNARKIKYKVVVIYNDASLEKEFSFTNRDISLENEVTISCEGNPHFIDNYGTVTLICNAPGENNDYQWAKVTAESGLMFLNDTEGDESGMIIQGNKIINLPATSIYNSATFKCQAINNGTILGVASQLVTNTTRQNVDEQVGNLLITNGTQVFKYTSEGIAPTNDLLENPQIIPSLGFILRTADGKEVLEESINDTDILWTVPIKNTLLKRYQGSLVSKDENTGVAFYNGKILGYDISENYYTNKTNNEIVLQIKYQNIVYTAKTNFLFLKDGESGTNGTNYIIKIVPQNPIIGRLKVATPNETGNDWFKVQLYYNNFQLYDGNHDGHLTTGENVKINWSIIGDTRATHNISVISNGDQPPTWSAASAMQSDATDIVKATVSYNDTIVTATMPVIYSDNLNSNYIASLRENTGFTHVTYSEDGYNPVYDNHSPFEIVIKKLINNEWIDITGNDSLTYNWSAIGNLKITTFIDADEKTEVTAEPAEYYNSETTHHAVVCEIYDGETFVGTLHIPIHFLINAYGHTSINGWDGNSTTVDTNGNKMLLAPQAGFGRKEIDNSYTGVLFGSVKDYTTMPPTTESGILGYNHGIRTIFLNSLDGSATFGATGKAQIILDPGNDEAILKSGDYDETIGTGMQINLSAPNIKYGNGKFQVDSDGKLTATDGSFSGVINSNEGNIAGWIINSTSLVKDFTANGNHYIVTVNSDGSLTDNYAFRVQAGTGQNPTTMFGAQYNGTVVMKSAQIGSGNNVIIIGKDNTNNNNSAIRYKKQNLLDANNGFFIGTTGIGLGKVVNYGTSASPDNHAAFEVSDTGKLYANDGTFKGVITTTSGSIGGWTINSSGLTNGVVKLNSDGSSTIYTVADLIIIRGYIMGYTGFELSAAMINHYDLNGDGQVTAADYVRLQNLIGISMQS